MSDKPIRCRHWARGYCERGTDCKFAHTGNAGDHFECRYYARGNCLRGTMCDFKHSERQDRCDLKLVRQHLEATQTNPPQPKHEALCRHFLKGVCALGEVCRFTHQTVDA